MHLREGSLRLLVQKWLSPRPAASVMIKRARMPGTNVRYIKFSLLRDGERVVMFFFQHDDGGWYVFPPEAAHATMDACHMAA
jgi:hypothetical protein